MYDTDTKIFPSVFVKVLLNFQFVISFENDHASNKNVAKTKNVVNEFCTF